MEHGASERVKEQSHTLMPVNTEVDKAAQSTAYCKIQTNANFTEEETALMVDVKSEAALLVKEEVVEDGWRDIAEQQCVQGPSTSAIVGSTNVFDSIVDLDNILNVKEELGAIDIGPTVLQHMDTWYTTNQKDVSVVKQERTLNHDKTDPILCGGVKEEIIKAEWRGSPTPQDSLMEQPGMCTTLHSLRKECLETVCRVELRRLDTFQCEVCDAVYIDAHKLLQHAQEVHGPGPKISLDRHVKSPEISNRPQQSATVSSPAVHTCKYCHKTYASKQGLFYHTEVVHTKARYRCSECSVEYKGKHLLQRHMKKVHLKEKHETDTDDQHGNEAVQSKQRAQTQSYSCDKCGKTYTKKKSLREHNKNLHSTECHKCSKCNKKFPSKDYLNRHTRSTHSEQEYECAVCKKICTSKPALNVHVYRVHRLRPAADTDDQRGNEAVQSKQRAQTQSYRCDKCGKTYTKKKSLREHNKSLHSTECHKCTKCNKKFPSKAYLQRHTHNVHSEQQYECAVCKKICKSKAALYQHVYQFHRTRPAADTDAQCSNKAGQSKQRARSQSYSCDKCVKTYACKESLLAHNRNLHSTESHECTKCNRKFPSKSYLYSHTSSAHSEQEYGCAVCKKICKSKASLSLHVFRVHRARPAVSSPVIYTCDYCHKTYTSKEGLVHHIDVVHTKVLYRCSECNKEFTGKLNLQRHIRKVHSKEKHEESHQLHSCTNCGRNFTSKWNCQRHEKRGKCARPTAGNTSAAASTSRQQHNVVIVKEEPADGELELGPVVFQHMDCNYRPYKPEPRLD